MDHRPPALFVADAVGLDFLNTIATPADKTVEWLASGEDLLAWLGEAGLLTAEDAAQVRALALPGELDAVAVEARGLREWFRSFVLAHEGRPLTADTLAELEPLNRLLERDEAHGAVVSPGGPQAAGRPPLAWRWRRRWRTPGALLQPVAQAMAELVCNADFTQVKACEGASCTLVFLDTTHAHRRRWCSMGLCGNRAKQAAHRRRGRHTPTH